MKKHTAFLTILILCLLLSSCAMPDMPLTRTDFLMDTVVTIKLYDSRDEDILDECFEICRRYEALFSRTIPDSDIGRLNAAAAEGMTEPLPLSPETIELIRIGLEYGELSDGRFDITIAPLSTLWDFGAEDPHVPSDEEISRALALVDYRKVQITEDGVLLPEAGMAIDLGGIAKGYIADRLAEYLRDAGVASAVISLGGNVYCVGSRPDKKAFRISIENPDPGALTDAGVYRVADASVVTSGGYERGFTENGKWYHHILDTRTGYPVENDLASVTIFSADSVVGDALSTTCFALGFEEGLALINSLPDVYAMFITTDNFCHDSEGLTDHFPSDM